MTRDGTDARNKMARMTGLLLAAALAVVLGACQTGPTHSAMGDEPPMTMIIEKPTPETTDDAVESVTLGLSVEGRPIRMHVFGDDGPAVLIFAGIHGNEPTSEYVALRLIDHLLHHPEAYTDRRVAILPSANPDGLLRRTRRNANGVDCNRNFPATNWAKRAANRSNYGGPWPASEPETGAIIEAVQRLDPVRIVSIHSASSFPPCNNFDGPADALARAMSVHNGYPPRSELDYATPGSFGTWAGVEAGIPTITLELPRKKPGPAAWEVNAGALVAFIAHGDAAGPGEHTTTDAVAASRPPSDDSDPRPGSDAAADDEAGR